MDKMEARRVSDEKLEQRKALALAVADAIGGGWTRHNCGMQNDAVYVGYGIEHDMVFRIGYGGDAGREHRLHISTWSWPSYTEREQRRYGGDGTRNRKTFTPSMLHPKEDVASITVSAEKSAEAIVKDIRRRFLSEYERVFKCCVIEAQRWQKVEDGVMGSWAAICKVIGPSAADLRDTQYPVMANGKNYGFKIENRDGKAHIEVDLTAEQLRKVLDVLKQEDAQ